ncbi:MAG TPA: cell division protein FtsA [Candidatus Parcubacteria bacterium]|nr:cell division protein FtsA [Candidatus Parcubacteria bacterium]
MTKSHIITALDIGSSAIRMISIARNADGDHFEVLSQGKEESLGVRRGVVVDSLKVAEIISKLKEKSEKDIGSKIESVYTNINGSHLFCVPSRGLVSVSRADQKISEEDVERVVQASKAISLSSNQEIIDVFPRSFIVDEGQKVKNAVGMDGVRLEAEVLALCGFSPYIKNLNQAVLNTSFQFNTLVPSYLAAAKAVLLPREKELGVCVLDIGAGTTNLAVFEEENLIHAAVFPVGSANITNDLAICLKTDIDTAEKIKLEFAPLLNNRNKAEKKIKIEADEPLVFSKKMLADIIEARILEIFDWALKELKKISRHRTLPAGVVLTGGGAKLPGIKELAKNRFKLPSRIGIQSVFADFREDPSLSTLCGLALEGAEAEDIQEGSGNGIINKLKKIFSVFIP